VNAADLDPQETGSPANRLVELALPDLVGGEQEFLGFIQLVSRVGRQVEGLFESLLAEAFDT